MVSWALTVTARRDDARWWGRSGIFTRSGLHPHAFSPSASSSVRFELASPRGASTRMSGDDFFTSTSSSLPARLTGHTRLANLVAEGDEGGSGGDGATMAAVRVFVPYAAQLAMSELYHAHRANRLILRRWGELAQYGRRVAAELRPRAGLCYIKQLLRGWHRSAGKQRTMRRARCWKSCSRRPAQRVITAGDSADAADAGTGCSSTAPAGSASGNSTSFADDDDGKRASASWRPWLWIWLLLLPVVAVLAFLSDRRWRAGRSAGGQRLPAVRATRAHHFRSLPLAHLAVLQFLLGGCLKLHSTNGGLDGSKEKGVNVDVMGGV